MKETNEISSFFFFVEGYSRCLCLISRDVYICIPISRDVYICIPISRGLYICIAISRGVSHEFYYVNGWWLAIVMTGKTHSKFVADSLRIHAAQVLFFLMNNET